METRFPELQELEISVPDEARERQFAVIQQAIADVPPCPSHNPDSMNAIIILKQIFLYMSVSPILICLCG